jgi:hypothetical protein
MGYTNLHKELSDWLISFEEKRADFYLDSMDIPTVGIGFALIVNNGSKWVIRPEGILKQYLNLNDQQIKFLVALAERKSEGKIVPHEILKIVLKSYVHLSEQQIKDVLQYSLEEAQEKVIIKIGSQKWESLNLGQQMALTACAFRKGHINHIAEPVKSGDFQKVADILIKDTSNETAELKVRGEFEAELFLHGGFDKSAHFVRPELPTLDKITEKHKMTEKQLQELNPEITDTSKNYPGQKIKLSTESDNNMLVGHEKKPAEASTDECNNLEGLVTAMLETVKRFQSRSQNIKADDIVKSALKSKFYEINYNTLITCNGLLSKMHWLAFIDNNWLKLIDSENSF